MAIGDYLGCHPEISAFRDDALPRERGLNLTKELVGFYVV